MKTIVVMFCNKNEIKFGLQINADKTKVMTTAEPTCRTRCNNSVSEQVDTYVCILSIINHDGWRMQ